MGGAARTVRRPTKSIPWRYMSKEDNIEVTGTVLEKFPSGLFSVQLEHDRVVLAHLAGRLRRNRSGCWPATKSPSSCPPTT